MESKQYNWIYAIKKTGIANEMIFKKGGLVQQPVLRNSYTDFHENPKKFWSPLIRNKDTNIPSRSPHTTFIVDRFTASY